MLHRTCLKKGAGVPLVFLHGFLGNALDWEPVCSFLPDSHCVGLDLPGHGKSPFVEEIEIDLPFFHLIGYSMGGRLALRYTAAHPEKVASLTLLSTHPGLKSEEERQKRWEQDTAWAHLLFELPIDEFLDRWYNQSIFHSFKPDLSMRKNQHIPDLAASLLHYSLAKQPFYRVDECIVGERDEKFRSLFKSPIVIANAGHAVHLEQPKQIAEIIKQRVFA